MTNDPSDTLMKDIHLEVSIRISKWDLYVLAERSFRIILIKFVCEKLPISLIKLSLWIRSKKQRIKYVDYRVEIKVRSEKWGSYNWRPQTTCARRKVKFEFVRSFCTNAFGHNSKENILHKKSSFRKFAFTFVIAF